MELLKFLQSVGISIPSDGNVFFSAFKVEKSIASRLTEVVSLSTSAGPARRIVEGSIEIISSVISSPSGIFTNVGLTSTVFSGKTVTVALTVFTSIVKSSVESLLLFLSYKTSSASVSTDSVSVPLISATAYTLSIFEISV